MDERIVDEKKEGEAASFIGWIALIIGVLALIFAWYALSMVNENRIQGIIDERLEQTGTLIK